MILKRKGTPKVFVRELRQVFVSQATVFAQRDKWASLQSDLKHFILQSHFLQELRLVVVVMNYSLVWNNYKKSGSQSIAPV